MQTHYSPVFQIYDTLSQPPVALCFSALSTHRIINPLIWCLGEGLGLSEQDRLFLLPHRSPGRGPLGTPASRTVCPLLVSSAPDQKGHLGEEAAQGRAWPGQSPAEGRMVLAATLLYAMPCWVAPVVTQLDVSPDSCLVPSGRGSGCPRPKMLLGPRGGVNSC